MSDALEVAAEVLGVDWVDQVAELGGSRRSVVRRVRSGARSVIVKEYLQPDDMGSDLALTPSDPCPDNNLNGPDGLLLLDFEHAEIRHRAWEAAYLRVPWPSCWCAWQVPDGVSALALKAYLDAAYGSDGPPATFEADLDAATLLWCALSVSWFLPAALDANSAHNADDARMPGRWTLILARLALAARVSGSEPLTTWAESLRAALLARWGDRSLLLASAFR